MKGEQPPKLRIIVKKGHGGGHHGGAWKVAYSDFVTTMMALFIVVWIVGQNETTREAVAQYFKDPGAFRQGSAAALVHGGSGVLTGQPPGQAGTSGDSTRAQEDNALRAVGEDFKERMEKLGLTDTVKNQIKVELTPEGLRVELTERDGSPFFQIGSATVIPQMRPVLENLAQVLEPIPNRITIEGHTDSRQYQNGHAYSNWELSADRTNSARKIMEEAGLAAGRIDRLVGHADRRLLVPEDPLDARNRRIAIIIRRRSSS